MPDWYQLIVAAKYLGVAPWELMEQPMIWYKWALEAHNAEARAEKAQQSRANRKKG